MTTAQKSLIVFDSGLAFQIYNKPVRFTCEDGTKLWDIKMFWKHVESDGSLFMANTDPKGFADLDDCLDDMVKYVENYDNK